MLTINHDSGQKAWFKQQQRSVFMIANTNYFTTGSTFGLWTPYGVVAGYPYAYQMGTLVRLKVVNILMIKQESATPRLR